MAVVVDGRPAGIHAKGPVRRKGKILNGRGQGIEESNGHAVERSDFSFGSSWILSVGFVGKALAGWGGLPAWRGGEQMARA